jgi:Flp pilus assembly protein TadD
VARPRGDEDLVEGQDEEFVFHLDRGAELLSRGDAPGARAALERALELRPRDAKVLGLLGQAHYRLGKYEDAIVAWQRLVDENPAEPAARINLGLAFLRAKRQSQATRQLEIALDLNPDHKKAMGYLGLALLESGDPVRAREWFEKAGSEQMVARCDEVLAGAAAGGRTSTAAAAEEAEDALPVDVDVEDAGFTPVPSPAPRTTPEPSSPAPQPSAPAAAGEVASFADARTVAVPQGGTFAVAGEVLAVRAQPAVRVRLAGLLAVRGAVTAEPEVKRFRGRPTEKPFGEASGRLHRVQGEGVLLYATGARRFTPLRLTEAAFFREEAVFGIEDALVFENGRVPSSGAGELNLVHLRGQGTVLVVTAGEPQALQVSPEAPVRLSVASLVGWIGALTPRLVGLIDGGPSDVLGVELSGEGRVLVDPAAAEGEESIR